MRHALESATQHLTDNVATHIKAGVVDMAAWMAIHVFVSVCHQKGVRAYGEAS
jgi:hypothetical protein